MKKIVYILSASDRYNYGDLLFPIITKNELLKNDNIAIHNVSIVKSDLSEYGALPTESYKSLLRFRKIDRKALLIIAGGEVLGASWSRLYSFIYPWYFKIYNNCKNKKMLEEIIKIFLKQESNPFPFIPTHPKILENFEIIYHAVGGVGISSKKNIKEINQMFSECSYFSVRENVTFRELETNFEIPNLKLVPDSATIMSDFFVFDNPTSENYITFQVGHYKNGGSLKVINNELEKLNSYTGYPIYFVPIGNCPGHDDILSLKWLYDNAKYPCKLVYPINLELIMKTIAKSQLFIGTSLHGIITAISFSVPYVAVNPEIKKLRYYVETWSDKPFNEICNFKDIFVNSIERLTIPKKVLETNVNYQKKLVSESFSSISKLISVIV